MVETIQMDSEQLIASAIQYLIEGGEHDAAQLLLFCEVVTVEIVEEDDFDGPTFGLEVCLRGPRAAVDVIGDYSDPISDQVRSAFTAGLPFKHYVSRVDARASVYTPDANWRSDLHELIKGKGVSNQASGTDTSRLWQGFKLRSATEIKIAEALDRAGVLFFPLPKARVVTNSGRMNIEPDFVVCHEGRWGILEVDGEPLHPAERSALEHDRDRPFRRHGVPVKRFDAKM